MHKILNFLSALTFFLGGVILFNSCASYNRIQYADKEKLPNVGALATNGKNLHESIIILATEEDQKFCSGVVIDANYALTAAHCVDSSVPFKTIKVKIFDSEFRDTGVVASPIAVETYRDVAFLKGNFGDFKMDAVDFHGAEITLGMHMIACGFPSGGPKYCAELIHVGNRAFQYRTIGGPIYKGMSGGPVYNVRTGTVIGVNSAVDMTNVIISPLVGVLKAVRLE